MCSEEDNPCKAYGRRKAYGRAMKAFYRQEDKFSQSGFFKQVFMPATLTKLEEKLINSAQAGKK